MIHLDLRLRGAAIVVALVSTTLAIPVAVFAAEDHRPGASIRVDEVDCGSPDSEATIECHQPPAPTYDIVISEIMQNPAMVWDSVGEWFEVYNAGSTAVDLDGWTITDELNNTHVVAGQLVIEPRDYLVFGRNADCSVNGGVAVDYRTGTDIFLFNSSDRLVLLDETGSEVDRVVWDNGATFPDPEWCFDVTCLDGKRQRQGPTGARLNTVFGDGDLGTPGRPNSCATGTNWS